MSRLVSLIAVFSLVAAACSSGGEDPVGKDPASSSTSVLPSGRSDVTVGEIELFIEDPDPNSPVAFEVTLEPNEAGVRQIVYFGPKLETGLRPEEMLVFGDGGLLLASISLDEMGRPLRIVSADGTLVDVDYVGDTAQVQVLGFDGSVQNLSVDVSGPGDSDDSEGDAAVPNAGNAIAAGLRRPAYAVFALQDLVPSPAMTKAEARIVVAPPEFPLRDLYIEAECEASDPLECFISTTRNSIDVHAMGPIDRQPVRFANQADCDAFIERMKWEAGEGGAIKVGASGLVVGALGTALWGLGWVGGAVIGAVTIVTGIGYSRAISAQIPDCGKLRTLDVIELASLEAVLDATVTVTIVRAVVPWRDDYRTTGVTPQTFTFTPFANPEPDTPLPEVVVTVEEIVSGIVGEEESSTSTSVTVQTDEPFPWTYEGTVSQHIAAQTDFGAQGAIEYDNSFPVTITLNADGTVSGTVGGGSITTTNVRCTGTASNPGGEVSAGLRDIEPWQLTGTRDEGTVRFDRLSVWLASESDVEGTYTPSGIQADWEWNVSGEPCGAAGNLYSSVTGSFTLVRTEPPAP